MFDLLSVFMASIELLPFAVHTTILGKHTHVVKKKKKKAPY